MRTSQNYKKLHKFACVQLFIALAIVAPLNVFGLCTGDFDVDGDVDGSNLQELISDRKGIVASFLAADFGRTDCEPLPTAPLNQFTIGDSIGVGEAADNTIGEEHPEVVWSTGFALTDIVYTVNERFEDANSVGYFENDDVWDSVFNQAVSGAVMADFETLATAIVAEVGANPIEGAGMVSILLGNNDVCSALSIDDLRGEPAKEQFELEYRNGLDALSNSPATRDAFIHVSSIPAIYWLWNAKRTNILCRLIWRAVPCQILLENATNDCGPGDSHLDPDTINPGDGPNCIRRKQFHAAIRDDYNRILSDVLLEYKTDGRLPNAYFVDIFDIEFDSVHVNGGDCFHPSIAGHEMLAGEEWCRSPWGITDPICEPDE